MVLKLKLPVLIFLSISCSPQHHDDTAYFEEAEKNGLLVNEGYNRCLRYVHDWLEYADPVSGLIPENLEKGRDIWSPHNSAADNYAFMVLTSCLLDKDLFEGRMKNILEAEKELTSRLGALPASYSFTKRDFLGEELDTAGIIFGSSEYIKDGLIPLTEYMGNSPWSERMIEMLDDLSAHMRIARAMKGAYFGNAVDHEINGELLQTLSRVYWMTHDRKYLEWAIDIGDYYLLANPDLLLKNERLRLRDHGCEVIGGLSELYVTLHFAGPGKKEIYREKLYRIMDRILDVGRNDDGMFYNEVNMATGEVVDSTIVDNWGYIYNAYYSLFLVDDQTNYREAVLESFKMLNRKYRNFDWEAGSADGFADAIESGINLYNREPEADLGEWLDSEIRVMWRIQDTKLENSGIIEGWHGDGNFARTTIMYCLWKTNGVTVHPWQEGMLLGTYLKDGKLYIHISAREDWQGKLYFDFERHKEFLHLPIDYPRINQFPEWYSISENDEYVIIEDKTETRYHGKEIREGLEIKLQKGVDIRIMVEKI